MTNTLDFEAATDRDAMITKLEDARALKRVNLPLNLPVEHRTFSAGYSEHWLDLMNAHGSFMSAVIEYADGPRAGSPGKWRLVGRRLDALRKGMLECDAFIAKLDKIEGQMLAWFLLERAMPFVAYWESAIEAVNGGTPLTIKPGDIPVWVDDDA